MSLRDFTPRPDPMMEELSAIREEIGAQMLAMSPEERIEWLHRENERFLAEQGYELVPDPERPHLKRLVKKES